MSTATPPTSGPTPRELTIFIVAGEHSGDALGAKLMQAMSARADVRCRFSGVGGPLMAEQGLVSLFPLSDVAVMGPLAILAALPRLIRRVNETVAAAIAAGPDVVVIIDSPEFTHPIAKRLRRRRPDLAIVDYVSPSVWAWRPGRARKMRAYVDHVLGLLPFEPAAHKRLGGPPCTYVGHPLSERIDWLAALDPTPLAHRLGLDTGRPVLVVLPGSRRSEVARLTQPFGEALGVLMARGIEPHVLVPVVEGSRAMVETLTQAWPIRPHLVVGEEDKFRAFKLASAALAASGTVTLELAMAGTPMVVGYIVDRVAAPFLRRMIKAPTVVLANLVLGENAFPELLQEDCTPGQLADRVAPLLTDTPERRAQQAALARIPQLVALPSGTPSEKAADLVLAHAGGRVPSVDA